MAKDLWETLFRHPRFVPHGRGHLPERRRKEELNPDQRFYISNFEDGEAEKIKRFVGKQGEICHNPGCSTILRASNPYFYCSPCVERILRQHPCTNLTPILESMRRDRAPRQQVRRKSV